MSSYICVLLILRRPCIDCMFMNMHIELTHGSVSDSLAFQLRVIFPMYLILFGRLYYTIIYTYSTLMYHLQDSNVSSSHNQLSSAPLRNTMELTLDAVVSRRPLATKGRYKAERAWSSHSPGYERGRFQPIDNLDLHSVSPSQISKPIGGESRPPLHESLTSTCSQRTRHAEMAE